jgi:translation initiation factor IF-2
MKFTPQQLLEMARSGQLGTAPPVLPGKPGVGPARGGPNAPAARRGPIAPPPPGAPVAPPAEEGEDDRKGKGGHGRLGGATDRAGRRAKRDQRANERRGISSPVPASALLDSDEDGRGRNRGPRRHKGGRGAVIAPRKSHAQIEPPVTVRTLSEEIGVKASDILRKLINVVGLGININSTLDDELAMEMAMEFGVELEVVHERTAEQEMLDILDADQEVDESALEPRPPVITILGHVDHGKTSLLDKIRSANVVASETGGITQHIGAYQIEHNDRKVTFVDTPGHEAFTSMRARGANVTDIVVLVVAADDGVMPQTVEAIAHAKAAEVPVVVALNKIDLPNAESTSNLNKIYGELSQQGLNPTEWGGDTEVIRTSTLTGRGIDELLSTLETLAELLELKANPGRPATGTCLESSISEGRGVVATVLVNEGTLRVGDVLACGEAFGKVRALFDDKGRPVQEAGPSTPVEISGLDQVPVAGEKFAVLEDIGRAREVAETRRVRGRGANLGEKQALTLENIYTRMAEQKVKTLNLILKADVQGSLEAIVKELEKLKNEEVPIRILHKAVGGISESDVMLAEASDAIVIGFRVAPEDRAVNLAEEKSIDIRRYDIIYQVTDEIKKAVEGLLVPETKEVHLGRANVRQVFKITRIGSVAGCVVAQGTIERGAKARILREGREIYKGSIEALKRFKDDVREVREGYECGIKIANYDDIKVDDTIECYRIDVVRRTL